MYDDKISAYLTKLNSGDLSYTDSLRVTSLLHCLTDFERISDHAVNVVECVQQMQKEDAKFSKKAEEEMNIYSKAVRDMKRLRKGKCTIGLGLVLSDLAMNYERVADHCSNIAVYMMQLNDTGLEEHSFTEQMDEKESAEFTKLENEFEQKYEID